MLELNENIKKSPLYSEDLAPIPVSKRTWSLWDMSAIWVGMAVCIPTYLLASYMIKSGLNWIEAILIILVGNLIITIPMILNGHAGVKYGIPFPVIGRASFGTKGIHIAAIVRAIVACGWFGIQTWIGGLAFYAIWHALMGTQGSAGLDTGKFLGFFLFWLVNVYFIWKGTESIKWLEKYAAPILIAMGIALIVWGAKTAGGFGIVLDQSEQLAASSAVIDFDDQNKAFLTLNPVKDKTGKVKASEYKLDMTIGDIDVAQDWTSMDSKNITAIFSNLNVDQLQRGDAKLMVTLRSGEIVSSPVRATVSTVENSGPWDTIWSYLLWLTAMVGFWATMAISIADITRYTATQRNQIMGQFIGLPGTMALFSFVGIFVTCAALINFQDILISEDAPWDPVSLLAKFESPVVVIVAQIFMIIATLSTNIAANVIAPANAFSNILPSKLSFRSGGLITALLGILIMPWWLLDEISSLLIFVSGFLGPVLGILICDYFLIRNKNLCIEELFKTDGVYSYKSGFNPAAMYALLIGVAVALIGLFVPSLGFLYTLSWFTGFGAAFLSYYLLMKKAKLNVA